MGVAVFGSVYLAASSTGAGAASLGTAMSGTAIWLAVLSVAGLPAALVMVRGVKREPALLA